jgi:transposase
MCSPRTDREPASNGTRSSLAQPLSGHRKPGPSGSRKALLPACNAAHGGVRKLANPTLPANFPGVRIFIHDLFRKVSVRISRVDRVRPWLHHGGMSQTIEVEASLGSVKRIKRTAEEKRRIVEATQVPGASIARVAREHGVNANQVFQWRHEYRKGALGVSKKARAELLPVTLAAEDRAAMVPEVQPPCVPSGSINIELPGRALVSVEAGVDPALVRVVLESLVR